MRYAVYPDRGDPVFAVEGVRMGNEAIGLEFFHSIFWGHWGEALYLVLYLGCLLYLTTQQSRLMKQIFVWPAVILLFTIYNPFVMKPVLGILGWEDRYSRFYWLLPAVFLCAYLFSKLVDRMQSGEEKAAAGILVACILLLCTNSPVKVIPDENIYKIPDYVLEISEMIEQNKERENPIIIADQEVYSRIRQYDPQVIEAVNNNEMTRYVRQEAADIPLEDQYADESTAIAMFVKGIEVDINIVNTILQGRDVDFFVRNTAYYTDEYLQQLDIAYIGRVDGYELYRCSRE